MFSDVLNVNTFYDKYEHHLSSKPMRQQLKGQWSCRTVDLKNLNVQLEDVRPAVVAAHEDAAAACLKLVR